MEYRLLGRTGVRVAPLAIGTMNFGNPTPAAEVARIIATALDAGINLIDTANSYNNGQSEELIGAALRANGRRNEVILATKAHYPVGPGPNDQPGITAPLFGPRTAEQLLHVLPVLEQTLSAELRTACDELVPPGSAVVNFHNTALWMKMQI